MSETAFPDGSSAGIPKYPEGSLLITKAVKSKGTVGTNEALFTPQSFSLKSSAHRSLGWVLHRPTACEGDVLSVLLTQLVLPQGIQGLRAYI